ncbi:uncharacterized protein LOC134774702 [Penaeus indicus]|uniref:uncharacterized protein LOC134774702 n=1 Tax=Penaeus indicus TaxID=29960 RepID=UPI00300CDFDE
MMSSGRDELCGGAGAGGERGRRPHRTPPSAAVEAEMRLYLDKLREIVPHIPRNRKVTRLELIQHVIDYICDLQHALEDHPGLKDEHAARLLTPPTSPHQLSPMAPHLMPPTQPLHAHLAPSPHHMLPLPSHAHLAPSDHAAHMPPMAGLGARQPLGVLSTANTLQAMPMRRDVTKTTSRVTTISHTLPGST